MDLDRAGPTQLLDRWARKLIDRRSGPPPRWSYVVGAILLLGLGGASVVHFPWDDLEDPNYFMALALFLGAIPANLVVNAIEYRIQGRLVGETIRLTDALRISLLGSAANLLPIPGSILVRTAALASKAGASRAAATSVVTGAMWMATALVPAGLALWLYNGSVLGPVLIAAGLLLALVGVQLVRRLRAVDPFPIVRDYFAVEASKIVIGGVRLWLILQTIGFSIDFVQLVPLTLASASASATGFLPAGIGIREPMTAALARLVELPASVGFLIAAVDSVAGILFIVPAGLVLTRIDRSRSTEED